jgi:hypothetical protein
MSLRVFLSTRKGASPAARAKAGEVPHLSFTVLALLCSAQITLFGQN